MAEEGRAGALDGGEPSLSAAWLVLVVLIATVLGFAASLIYSQRVSSGLDEEALSIATDAAPAVEYLASARTEVLRIALTATDVVALSGELEGFDRSMFASPLSEMHRQISAYLTLPFYPEERDLYAATASATQALDAAIADLSSLLETGDRRGAKAYLRARLLPAASRAHDALGALLTFNTEQQHRLAVDIPRRRARGSRMGYLLQGGTAVLSLILMGLVVRGIQRYGRVLATRQRLTAEHARDVTAFGAKLESIIRASRTISEAITAGDERNRVFQTIADQARSVVNAQYCAVGCGTDPERPFDPWVFSGMPPGTMAALGHPPAPNGLLGAVTREQRLMRLSEPQSHPAFRGLPPGHPALGPFLGVPIVREGRSLASLYLARAPGHPLFSEEDEHAAELLAAQVRVAIVNSQLYENALAATRAREDLLATVSHDLKNPVNTIRLSVESLRSAAADPKATAAMERIHRATHRMAHLIADLLDAAKIEAGALRADRRPEQVAPLLDAALDLLRAVAADKSITLAYAAPPGPVTVWCERHLILRVLANLIGNAIKFSPGGSSISVVAATVGESVRFSVVDAGSGIRAEHLPHVFDRYWQQKDGDRRGSGLGLYIAKGIVEAHGGQMWIDSAPGRGTTVHFTLPLLSQGEQTQPVGPPPS